MNQFASILVPYGLDYMIFCTAVETTLEWFYRVIEKSRTPFITRFNRQTINYFEIWKQKKCYIKCCKCPPRSEMHASTLFFMFDANSWVVPVSRKRFTRRDIIGMFGTGENVSLNSFCQDKQERDARWCSTVNTRCSNGKDILALDCWKTTDGPARSGYNMVWPVWALAWSQWYCVFVNPVEMYWTATTKRYFNVGCVTFRSTYTRALLGFLGIYIWGLSSLPSPNLRSTLKVYSFSLIHVDALGCLLFLGPFSTIRWPAVARSMCARQFGPYASLAENIPQLVFPLM
jgi:hypothetical protein